MSPETAVSILNIIGVIALVILFVAALFIKASQRVLIDPSRGEFKLPGEIKSATERFAKNLNATGRLYGIDIDTLSPTEVRWNATYRYKHRGILQMNVGIKETTATWQITFGRALETGALIALAIAALVIAALYYTLYVYVVPHENGAVRAQVFQMVHALHVLWPPFLLIGLARRKRSIVIAEIRKALQALRF